MRYPIALLFVTLLVSASACNRKREETTTGSAELTSAAVRQSVDDATARIARARCERTQDCTHRGVPNPHTDMDQCFAVTRAEVAHDVTAEACPRGVDSNKVAKCVAMTLEAPCEGPLEVILRVEDCRAEHLCL